jgi:glyoxylase I family protein
MAVEFLSHIGICVSQLERSLAFYRDALGFREVHRLRVEGDAASTLLELEAVQLEAVYLERDQSRIELLHYLHPELQPGLHPPDDGVATPRPMNAMGLTHLSLRVSDLDATLGRIEAAGGSVMSATRTGNPAYRAGAVFALDPDGTRIELVEMPGDPKALPGT